MVKKLVFLHGSGSDKNAYGDLMQKIALNCNADLISFNAPFKHSDKIGKYKLLRNKKKMVGETRFELAAPSSQN